MSRAGAGQSGSFALDLAKRSGDAQQAPASSAAATAGPDAGSARGAGRGSARAAVSGGSTIVLDREAGTTSQRHAEDLAEEGKIFNEQQAQRVRHGRSPRTTPAGFTDRSPRSAPLAAASKYNLRVIVDCIPRSRYA